MKTTVNLEEKLIARKTARKSLETIDFERLLQQVDSKEVANQLYSMGFGAIAHRVNTIQNDKIHLKDFPEDKIFTLNEIRQICIDYRLRFLETKRYKGTVSLEAYKKLEELKKNYPTTTFDPGRFWIVAPKSSFNLRAKPADPILFYHLFNESYLLIHKWGKDISCLRRLVVWPLTSESTVLISGLLLSSSIASIFWGLTKTKITYDGGAYFALVLCSIVLCLIIGGTIICNSILSWDKWDKDIE